VVQRIDDHDSALEVVFDPIQRVRVAFVDLAGTTIELIEPVGDDSPVRLSLEKGTKLVHLCFEVPGLEAALTAAAGHGFHVLGAPAPAVAFAGRRIAWCFSKTFGLVELLEATLLEASLLEATPAGSTA
jgi:methylmalonyl-CoA/ethylmalonyl-CoA epimerase